MLPTFSHFPFLANTKFHFLCHFLFGNHLHEAIFTHWTMLQTIFCCIIQSLSHAQRRTKTLRCQTLKLHYKALLVLDLKQGGKLVKRSLEHSKISNKKLEKKSNTTTTTTPLPLFIIPLQKQQPPQPPPFHINLILHLHQQQLSLIHFVSLDFVSISTTII